MAETVSQSGQFMDAGIPVPGLTGEFIPAIDNPSFAGGYGIIVPWGGGHNIRESMLNMGISKAAGLGMPEFQQDINLANYVFPMGDITQSYQFGDVFQDVFNFPGLIGAPGPMGQAGPQGVPGEQGEPGEPGEPGVADLWQLTCWAVIKSIPTTGNIITADIYNMANVLVVSGENVTCVNLASATDVAKVFPEIAVNETILVKYINGVWYAVPLFEGKNTRQARTTEDAQSSTVITANLFDKTGTEILSGWGAGINVYCNTNGGGNLDVSVPLLRDNQDMMVTYKGGQWWCVESFNVGQVAKAFVKTTPGAVTSVVCWFDITDSSGEEITVPCNIVGGGNLNEAIPRLVDGTPIDVTKVKAVWSCSTVFQTTEDCECTQSPLPVAEGGTGAATAALACSYLGVGTEDSPSFTAVKVEDTQVVGARVIDERCDDAIDSGDATTDGVIDALRDAMITHGLLASS